MTPDERQLLKVCCAAIGLLVDHGRRGAGIQEYEWVQRMIDDEITPVFERVFAEGKSSVTTGDKS